MDSASPNFAAFKEPKAFIKILQIVLTILAFALTTSFTSQTIIKVHCNVNETVDIKDNVVFGNYSSNSQFFVFVGVITMLYCFAAIILYVFFSELTYQNERVPKIDFIITVVIVVLWFIGSIAWADGVSKLKFYTGGELIIKDITFCQDNPKECTVVSDGTFGSLNASLIAGFANVALWAANLWFLFKETLWYERRNPNDQIIGNESVDGGNM